MTVEHPGGDRGWMWLVGLVLLGLLSLASRLDARVLGPAAGLAVVASVACWFSRARGGPGEGEEASWSDHGLPGEASWAWVVVFLFVAVSLVAVWVGQRRPWTPWAGALLWVGALWWAARPLPKARLDALSVGVGLVVGGMVGFLAGVAVEGGVFSVLHLAVVVPVGRLVLVRVVEGLGVWVGGVFALAALVPFVGGTWGLAAVGVEALFAGVLLEQVERGEERDAWALGGVGAGVGVGLALLMI